ncbi:hypothetical protein OUZ56_020070 [Daphnia magna]|uniref:Uncharacterized protein n=1 Tax=Daphnia magna TaxID=35525 RepID=A0ABQ9ZDG4_9CRUS|nr:hypothetical protein OUZ56_020070 [Daphnia magna]
MGWEGWEKDTIKRGRTRCFLPRTIRELVSQFKRSGSHLAADWFLPIVLFPEPTSVVTADC